MIVVCWTIGLQLHAQTLRITDVVAVSFGWMSLTKPSLGWARQKNEEKLSLTGVVSAAKRKDGRDPRKRREKRGQHIL